MRERVKSLCRRLGGFTRFSQRRKQEQFKLVDAPVVQERTGGKGLVSLQLELSDSRAIYKASIETRSHLAIRSPVLCRCLPSIKQRRVFTHRYL